MTAEDIISHELRYLKRTNSVSTLTGPWPNISSRDAFSVRAVRVQAKHSSRMYLQGATGCQSKGCAADHRAYLWVVHILAADGQQDLANSYTRTDALWLSKGSTHSGLHSRRTQITIAPSYI